MTGGAAVGALAACLTTGAWIPQLVRTWRFRSARDLSWSYLAMMLMGVMSWLAYGIDRHDPAVIGANVFSLAFVLALSAFKVISDRAPVEPGLAPPAFP